MSKEHLEKLNNFRIADGKEPFKDWRNGRHAPMLEAYENTPTVTDITTGATGDIVQTIAIDDAPKYQPVHSDELNARCDAMISESVMVLARLASQLPKRVDSTPEEIAERRAERAAKLGVPAPEVIARSPAPKAEKQKALSYKEIYRQAPEKSLVGSPVKIIHAYLAQHYGQRSRKVLVAELAAMGINLATCRTQYQVFKRKLDAETAAAKKNDGT